MGPVLVPVDFSDCSKAALALATQVGLWVDAPLLVLHVVHDRRDRPGFYGRGDHNGGSFHIRDSAQRMMAGFLEDFAGEFPDLRKARIESRLIEGIPARRIVEVASLTRTRLVVMASEPKSGIRRVMEGSTAEQVSRRCPVPVTLLQTPPGACESRADDLLSRLRRQGAGDPAPGAGLAHA
ncbi:MAG: universal stress protein [Chromatiales bacterium]|jgi:nucleotide-binding universal stress UspA family protein